MVAAIRSDVGASRRLLVAGLLRRFTTLVSTPLLIEYEAVMTRESHLRASRLTIEDVIAVLDAVAAVADPVRLSFHWRPMAKDPDDDMVLETAVNGTADGVVTFNVRDIIAAATSFGIEVLSPAAAIKRLEIAT
jgi:predicted nucleic acid-binding protein